MDDFILDKLQKKLTIVSTTLDDKKEMFGVQADSNLINLGSKNIEAIKYNRGEICDEFELCEDDDMEKKMFDDLGETTGKKEKDKDKEKKGNKSNNNKKRKKKGKRNKKNRGNNNKRKGCKKRKR